MLKKERQIYKSGRKNSDGYKFYKLTFKERTRLLILTILAIVAIIISILEVSGITNWNKINSFIGAVNGVSQQDTDFSVYYLDVGQSDCSIVVSGEDVMIIDTGTYTQWDNIQEALHSLNIDTINYLVISHQHDDHMSCAEEIMRVYDVKNIIMPKLSKENLVESETYERLLRSIANYDVNPIVAEHGNKFPLGDATVNIFAPLKQYSELNNMSIVLKIVYGDTSFLFQGDAESQVEDDLLDSGYNLTADVLKLGHHGSKTSSTEDYIDTVNPKVGIISCGKDNTYGHPRAIITEYLEERDIDYYITASSGDIIATSNGKTITILTEKSEKVFYYCDNS